VPLTVKTVLSRYVPTGIFIAVLVTEAEKEFTVVSQLASFAHELTPVLLSRN
jgi:hypothetical protein